MADRKDPSLKRRLTYLFGSWALQLAAVVASIFPAKWIDRFGTALGRVWLRLDRKHRNRARSNLRMCFPEWSSEKTEQTIRNVFEHFGRTALRFLRAERVSREQLLAETTLVGMELLDQALEQGRGVLLISAHLGNWEQGAQTLSALGYTVTVVARDANSARITEMINRRRRSQRVNVLARGDAARGILKALRRNELVAILPDQNTWEIYVPFFGIPAGTASGPAVMHLRTGAPILGTFYTELPDGKYLAKVVQPEMPECTHDLHEDARRIMTAVNQMIENEIRETPDQWLWMHDRWKSAREQGLLNG